MARDDQKGIFSLLNPIVTEEGCELVHVEVIVEMGRKTLRLYIDKTDGVTLGDCSRVSRAVGDLLEVEDAVAGRYHLEVSSPGFNRPLSRLDDFKKFTGHVVSLATKEPLNGRKNYKGTLDQAEDNQLVMTIDGQKYVVPFDQVAKAHLVQD